MKPNLLIICAGPGSVHEQWDDYDQYNFDLAILQWNTGDRLPNTERATYYEQISGHKFHNIAKFMNMHDSTGYEYVQILDDDCITTPELIAATFDYCRDNGFDIAQPALTHESYIAHEPTKLIPDARHHITDTVEIMCPIFSQRCWPEAAALFEMLPDGTGPELEVYWRIVFESDRGTTKYGGKVGVIDQYPVYHGRPVTTPDMWAARGMIPGRDSLWLQSIGYRGWSFKTIEIVT